MQISIPFTVLNANLTASNLAEDDYPVWDVATAYVVDDYVISTTTHSVYVCVAGTTGDDPDTDTANAYWLRVGATNRWKPFDKRIGDPAVGPVGGSITYTLGALGVPANNVTLFGLAGQSVTLVVTDATDGEVYNETITLIDTGLINDGFTYCFEPNRIRTEAVFADIPPYASAEFALTLTAAAGNTPTIGQITLGQAYVLGVTHDGTGVSINDYSIKDTDDWGNYYVLERAFAKRVDYEFITPAAEVRRTAVLLETVRAVPAVYFAGVGVEQYGATVYGFPKNWDITHTGTKYASVSLEVEGLT